MNDFAVVDASLVAKWLLEVDTGPYLGLLTIAGAVLATASVIWLLVATAFYNTLREKLRGRSRQATLRGISVNSPMRSPAR